MTPLSIIPNVENTQLFLSYRDIDVELLEDSLLVTAPMDGLRRQVIAGIPWVVLPIRCKMLGSDNRCQVYGTDARPIGCATWPMVAWQLQTLPDKGRECGFTFTPEVPNDQAKETSWLTPMLALPI